jgi:hypothetical protein
MWREGEGKRNTAGIAPTGVFRQQGPKRGLRADWA